MVLRPRRRALRPLVVSTVLVLLAGCGVAVRDGAQRVTEGDDIVATGTPVEPTTEAQTTPSTLPPVDLTVQGAEDNRLNEVATTAIADLEVWWAEEYPKVFGGPYEPLTGGLFAYDRSTDPTTVPCVGTDIEAAMFNAFYCGDADIVAWDQEELLPDFAERFGEFTIAVVLAHEWGHVIQAPRRADMEGATITLELQADCYAGAWVRHAAEADEPYFEVDAHTLDGALSGVLSLKDAPGSSSDAPNAHGSGFDRVSAFQDGYLNGVATCADYSDETLRPYQFPFNDEADYANEGNMDLESIKTEAAESLEAFWTDTFPEIADGKAWPGLQSDEFQQDSPLDCRGEPVKGYRLFLCWPDRYVGFSTEAATEAYEHGDFAVATLLATQYGLAVQLALGDDLTGDPVTATLRGDCYAGAWGAGLISTEGQEVPESWRLILSPGDLDEGIAVLLAFRTESDRARQGPGFDRVTAFRKGVVDGAEVCHTLEAGGT